MAGAVGDELDQLLVRTVGRRQPVEHVADAPHDIDVAALVAAADIVGLAEPAALGDQVERAGMILDEQPVADILALAIDRQWLARRAR